MARQPTRLADFQSPRGEAPSHDITQGGEPPMVDVLHGQPSKPAKDIEMSVEMGRGEMLPNRDITAALQSQEFQSQRSRATEPVIAPEFVPVRIVPRPVAEVRQAMTVRLPVSLHERMRMLMFTSRRSQQDIVEEALDAFLRAHDV
jgi:hypothetical protein